MDVAEALGLPLQVASLLLVHHLVVLELLHGLLLLLLLLIVVLVLVVADLLRVHFRTVTDAELIDQRSSSVIGNDIALRSTLVEGRQTGLVATWHACLVLLLEQSLLIIASV